MAIPVYGEERVKEYRTVCSRLSARFRVAFEYMEIMDLHEHDLKHEATCRWLEMRDASGSFLFRLEEVNRIMGWAPGSAMAHRYASLRAEDMAAKLWMTSAGPEAAADGA